MRRSRADYSALPLRISSPPCAWWREWSRAERSPASRHPAASEPVHWLLALVTLVALLSALRRGPVGAPLGYANANAALCNVLIGLCGLALAAKPARSARVALWIAVPLLTLLVLATRSPLRYRRGHPGVG